MRFNRPSLALLAVAALGKEAVDAGNCGIHAKHKFFFTFGQNTNLKNSYVMLEEENSVIARKKMIEQYGTVWAFQYSQTQFEGQPERYGLNEVVFGTRVYKQE